jgi:hypothetical protein
MSTSRSTAQIDWVRTLELRDPINCRRLTALGIWR